MEKINYLFKNIGFLTLSSFGIKIISFFLVPLYTKILTTAEYGTYDLFNTTVSLLIPFFTLNIKEATMRFALSNEYEKKDILTISIHYSILSVFYFGILILVNYIFNISQAINDYKWFILLMFVSQNIQGIITNFVRGLDRLKEIAISSVVCSLVVVTLNIVTLLPLHMGLMGYFLANSVGLLVQCVYLIIICKGWNYISFRHVNKKTRKEMVYYALPMVANSTAWWINSVSDRYVIIGYCGMAANGIYSVAGKIPTIVDMFQGIFSQAWTLSAVKEFEPEDKGGFFSNIYSMYNMCMTITSAMIIVISRFLAKFLYANNFYTAWRYVPFLIIAVLFGALAGYFGAIFSAVKKSKLFAYSTLAGAFVNIVLNIILVKWIGLLGAAISTTVSYAIIYCLRYVCVKKIINLKIRIIRDCVGYCILVVQTILFLFFEKESWILYLLEMVLFVVILALFREQYSILISKFKNRYKERKNV